MNRIIALAIIIGTILLSALYVYRSEKKPAYGQTVPAIYTTGGGLIYKNGTPIQLKGVNWGGEDLHNNYLLSALYIAKRTDLYTILQREGFNAIRIPICPYILKNVPVPPVARGQGGQNDDLPANTLDALDTVISEISGMQMYFVLAHSKPDCDIDDSIAEAWFTSRYSEAQWIADLQFLANRYKNNEYFVGIDLKDQPHTKIDGTTNYNLTWGTGSTTTDWKLAAERAGAAVLSTNSNILIFVEGVSENATCSTAGAHWWGGNFEPFKCTPIDLTKIPKNKLVLSPHIYGRDLANYFSYFNTPDFPNNMPTVWDKHFGFLVDSGYTVIPAAWGSKYGTDGGDPLDVGLMNKLVSYFQSKKICSSMFWTFNTRDDPMTGGILKQDIASLQIWNEKMTLLKNYWNNCAYNIPLTPSVAATPTRTPTPITPTISPTSSACGNKTKGDSNCDNKIDIVDFEIWRKEFMKTLTTSTSDFNSDAKVDLVDFEIWRKGFMGA